MPFRYKRDRDVESLAEDGTLRLKTGSRPRWALLLVNVLVIVFVIGALWISVSCWLAYEAWGSTPRWFRLLLVWAVAISGLAYRKRYLR